ncbi:MAG: ACP S-malonyltransferase, partial [Bdellovibrionales bacterium]|nr:ACP S-malonyltransferase [Bdellovibrionales bacterium]
ICYTLYKENPSASPLCAAAGHSLGEYSALVAAGALSFEDAVQLVHKRGSYMQEAVPVGTGKMVAVLGKEIEEIESALSQVDGIAEVANINAPGQIVVAGSAEGINAFVKCLENPKVKELPVSAPFHCSLMKPAEEKLAKDLKAISLSPATFPVYANYHAKPLTEPEEIREALRLQVCGRVRWVESMQAAIKDHTPSIGLEFGSGKVLSGLMKRIDRGLTCQSIGSLSDIEAFV